MQNLAGTLLSPRHQYGVQSMRVVNIPSLGAYDLTTGEPGGAGWRAYSRSPWAFACMQIRGSEIANLPWRITRNGVIVKEHPLIDMLTQFGTESNYAEALQATEIDLCMRGKAFWLRDADELQRLQPNTISVKRTDYGITGFEQKKDGKVINTFAREDVIYFREFNPSDLLEPGTPILDVVDGAVQIE